MSRLMNRVQQKLQKQVSSVLCFSYVTDVCNWLIKVFIHHLQTVTAGFSEQIVMNPPDETS